MLAGIEVHALVDLDTSRSGSRLHFRHCLALLVIKLDLLLTEAQAGDVACSDVPIGLAAARRHWTRSSDMSAITSCMSAFIPMPSANELFCL